MKQIFGHTAIIDALIDAQVNHQLHPGLLFTGPEGVGKKTVAYFLAQAILCENGEGKIPCGGCPACFLFQSKNHPDFFSFDPSGKEQGSVEALRTLLHQLSMQSFRGRAKVVVIDNADSFSVSSANIFLKTLEEPRPRVFFIMIASNSSRLPITIRSRAQRWEFQPLTATEMQSVVAVHPEISVEHGALFDLADGSITQLKRLSEKAELVVNLQSFVKNVVVQRRATEAMIFMHQLAKDKESLPEKISLLIPIVRAEMRAVDDVDMVSRLSLLLRDLISAQYILFERNVNALIVLTDIVKRVVMSEADMTRSALLPDLAELTKGY